MKAKLIILSSTLASVAHAQVVQPLPYPHNKHAICHDPKALKAQPYSVQLECSQIRAQEKDDYNGYVNSASWVDVTHADGVTHDTGRKDVYNQSLVKGTTTESTFAATAWLKRNVPNFWLTSAHPEWEDAKIDSCDEYAYKRTYAASRYLDILGGLNARRAYAQAVDVMLSGIPAYGGKAVAALANSTLRDFDGNAMKEFNGFFTGNYKQPFTAWRTGTQPRNPFYQLPSIVGITVAGTHTAAWDSQLAAAMSTSRGANSTSYYWAPEGEFYNARNLKGHADITSLSASEAEAIAQRVDRMYIALRNAMQGFQTCVNRRWRERSLATGVINYKESLKYGEYARARQPGAFYTDPVDQLEMQLQAQLLDSATSQATLDNMLAASTTGTDTYARFARTPTGTMLRALATVSKSNVVASIYDSQSSFKGSYVPECALSEDFEEVRQLLIDEHARGEAGCMSSKRRCDFVPQLFVRDMVDRLTAVVHDADDAKEYCMKIVGGFDDTSSPVPVDKRDTIIELEDFFKTEKAKIDEALRDAPRKSLIPDSIGDRRHGGTTWGDPARFGAGYSYNGEWAITATQRRSDSGEPCELGGRVQGHLDAFVTAFGVRQDLVNVTLSATTKLPNSPTPVYSAYIEVAGDVIYTVFDDEIPPNWSPDDYKAGWDIPIVKTTIIAGFIPISLEVAVGFEYGAKLGIEYKNVADCALDSDGAKPQLSIDGHVTPYAGANASVSAYVDLFIVGAGLKGKLTLIEASLPFEAGLSLSQHTDGLYVHADSSFKLVLQELSGSLSFIVKAVGITVLEHELFSWPGFRQEVSIWKENVAVKINGLNYL